MSIGDKEVKLEVICVALSARDAAVKEGTLKSDFIGSGVVGRIVEAGKDAFQRQIGEVVGVYLPNKNTGQTKSHLVPHLTVPIRQVVYLPNSIPHEHAASLLSSGIVAYNALSQPRGNKVAVVGTNSLAYFACQFAKKAFNSQVTVFGQEEGENKAQELGADAYELFSVKAVEANTENFDQVVLATSAISADEAQNVQNLVRRTGQLVLAAELTSNPRIILHELILAQRELTGAKRGSWEQWVRMLEVAASHHIRGRVETFKAADQEKAWEAARVGKSEVVVRFN